MLLEVSPEYIDLANQIMFLVGKCYHLLVFFAIVIVLFLLYKLLNIFF